MKTNLIKRIACITLCAICAVSFTMPTQAATKKVTAASTRQKAKTVKAGKTVVTVKNPAVTHTNSNYVQFKATKSKTYKVTINNVRKKGKSSANDIIISHVDFTTPTSYGGFNNIAFKQNGQKVYSMYLCSAKSWSLSNQSSVSAYTALKSRTAKIKLKKGQYLTMSFSNINRYKGCFDLTIK